MTSIAITTRHPTLFVIASQSGIMDMLGDFIWPKENGPVENILRLVDFGLMFVLPFPTQMITMVAGLFGYDLQALGKHIDKMLGLNNIEGLANLNIQDAASKLIPGLSVEEQKAYIDQTLSSNNAHDQYFPLTASQMNDKMVKEAALVGSAVKLLSNMAKTWSRKRRLGQVAPMSKKMMVGVGAMATARIAVTGVLSMLAWLVKLAYKFVTTSATVMLKNPVKSLLAAGAVGIGLSQYGDDYDPKEDDGEADKIGGKAGDILDKEAKYMLKGKPTTFKKKLEFIIDQTILGVN